MNLNKGTILSNRYEIISLAGRGGMAEVYQSRDINSGEIVAIKALKPEFNDDPEFVRRFDLEARAAASLDHPNIVNVFGVGEDKGIRYIVQEYVDGRSLKEEIQDKGKLDWRLAVPVSIQMALALEHAHSQAIIHRDIKPANILVTEDGVCIVTDFGIARAVNANTVTMTGSNAIGSVHYFSPEQARGGVVDHRTDIYSLGIVMYEMVTGKVPFEGETSVSIAIKHLQEKPKAPSEITTSLPKGLEDIILRCLEKNPDNRYPNIRALIDDLDNFMINPNGRYGRVDQTVPDTASALTPGSTVTRTISNDDAALRKVISLEESIDKRRRSKTRDAVLTVVIVVLALALLLFAVWFVVSSLSENVDIDDSNTTTYEMQDFRGRNFEEVEEILQREGIRVENPLEVSSEEVEAGLIIAQNYAPGEEINVAATATDFNGVQFTVSTGSRYSTVPNVLGQSIDSVRSQLRNELGFTVLEREQYSIEAPEGSIISISPAPGEQVERGSRVTVTISRGRNNGPVPDVTGNRLNDSIDYLNSIGFSTTVQIPSNLAGQEDELYVVSMSPDAGTSNVQNVTIIAGTYADANPTPTPIPTTTVPTTTTEATTTVEETTTTETTTTVATPAPTTSTDPTPAPTTVTPTTAEPTTAAPTTAEPTTAEGG